MRQRNALLHLLLKLSTMKECKQLDALFRNSSSGVTSASNTTNNSSLVAMKKSLMEIEVGL